MELIKLHITTSNCGFYEEYNDILERYPAFKDIGKHEVDESGEFTMLARDFSIVQEIIEKVYEKVVVDKLDENEYSLIIYDGYLE